MTDVVIVPAGNSKIVICHWAGSDWDAIEINHSALNGHDNHELDIWPPVEEVTPGHNWPKGEAVYLNGCVLEATPSPSPSESGSTTATPSPTDTLPPTGAAENAMMGGVGLALIVAGAWMKWKSVRT